MVRCEVAAVWLRFALVLAVYTVHGKPTPPGEINEKNTCFASSELGQQTLELQLACLGYGAYKNNTGYALGWREVASLDAEDIVFNRKFIKKRKAYIAVHDVEKRCAVVFQGTRTPRDVVYDLDGCEQEAEFFPGRDDPFSPPDDWDEDGDDVEAGAEPTTPAPDSPGKGIKYRVYPGFLHNLQAITRAAHWQKWLDLIRPARDGLPADQNPCSGGVYIIGHSLGGAAASLHKLSHFGENSTAAKVIVFGSPHPVKEGFHDCDGLRFYITSVQEKRGDPIPYLAPGWLHGHTGLNIHITNDSRIYNNIQIELQTKKCPQTIEEQDECAPYVSFNYRRHAMETYAYMVWRLQDQLPPTPPPPPHTPTTVPPTPPAVSETDARARARADTARTSRLRASGGDREFLQ